MRPPFFYVDNGQHLAPSFTQTIIKYFALAIHGNYCYIYYQI